MIGASIIFISKFPLLQIVVVLVSSFVQLLYMIKVKPFKHTYMNKLELFNEGTIFLLSYLLFGFTDYSEDALAKINI